MLGEAGAGAGRIRGLLAHGVDVVLVQGRLIRVAAVGADGIEAHADGDAGLAEVLETLGGRAGQLQAGGRILDRKIGDGGRRVGIRQIIGLVHQHVHVGGIIHRQGVLVGGIVIVVEDEAVLRIGVLVGEAVLDVAALVILVVEDQQRRDLPEAQVLVQVVDLLFRIAFLAQAVGQQEVLRLQRALAGHGSVEIQIIRIHRSALDGRGEIGGVVAVLQNDLVQLLRAHRLDFGAGIAELLELAFLDHARDLKGADDQRRDNQDQVDAALADAVLPALEAEGEILASAFFLHHRTSNRFHGYSRGGRDFRTTVSLLTG